MNRFYCKVRRTQNEKKTTSCTPGACELDQNEFVDYCTKCNRSKTVGRELRVAVQ